ncbi:carbohydrate ABC transporter permease [Verminephrobacter aporrectodeae subsp. tuberculatae]|uniref:carbohydrate ABC transporter permease n=1 Tax=Verminephrobacter aporrectodeae TaxID=1110389 RepID=UPI000237681F|nr:carbohydrate ABC transporter permease [Verminephrobacter aporrectodeae]MCW5221471.1 carbohydrate ABC transporter permease [Verminephrobacter aporrectodeae subsp. tuberculatae]MCW5290762.1 carbohydrate ABC transporter permease [Verminephrobacter aporrectodeae subsp. tuberculatae]MCW8198734.1 carbohydrate ABC transporter permease [Verminephrobacter aporrectodeae subsp. tuberculatae]
MSRVTDGAAPQRLRLRVARIALYAVLVLAAFGFLVPLVAMLFTSLKTMPEILGMAPFEGSTILSPPRAMSLDAWGAAWSGACIAVDCQGLKGYFWNSIVLCLVSVAISVSVGAVNGYALTKWRFRYDNVVFVLFLFSCFIPLQIVLIPAARLLGLVGLAGTMSGLIAVHVLYGIAFTTLFFRNFYVAIPDELIRCARIDGAGFWSIFLFVVVPISGPIAVVSIIWQFTSIWNDFLFGASFSGPGSRPLMVALNNLVNTSTGTKAYNVDMAAAMIAALPTMLVYIAAGRFFVRGLMAGAVKG